jgi:hypothetical protein
MATRLLGIAVALSIGIIGAAPRLAARPQPSSHADFIGTWRLDPAQTVDDQADRARLGRAQRRNGPCQPNLVTQDDLLLHHAWSECETFDDTQLRARPGGLVYYPTYHETFKPTLGPRLLGTESTLETNATSTVAIVAGAPTAAAMTFSTLDAAQTFTIDEHTVTVRARWRGRVLEQVIRGEEKDLDVRIRRTFEPSSDGSRMTVTTRLEAPKMTPPIKDVVRVYVRQASGLRP